MAIARWTGAAVWRLWPVTVAAIGLAVGFLGWSVVSRFLPVRRAMTITYSVERPSGPPRQGYTVYYRSDGAEAKIYEPKASSQSAAFRPLFTVSLPLQGIAMEVDPETHLVWTRRLAPIQVEGLTKRRPARTDSQTACLSELVAYLGPGKDRTCERAGSTILGFKVWKTRAIVGPPGRPLVFETYLAPSLDWHLLRQDQFEGGRLVLRVTATSVLLGNPPDTFFRAGEGAKSVQRSELVERSLEFRHEPRCQGQGCGPAAGPSPFPQNKELVTPVY